MATYMTCKHGSVVEIEHGQDGKLPCEVCAYAAVLEHAESAGRSRDEAMNDLVTWRDLATKRAGVQVTLDLALSRQRRVAGEQIKLADHLQMLAELLLTQERASLPGVAESVRRVQTDLLALAAELSEGM